MPELQYVIDTICARFSDQWVYETITARLKQKAASAVDIIPMLIEKDRSLDPASARRLVETAMKDMIEVGKVKVDGGQYVNST